ncbi:hypothetical protein GGR50DRAFT_598784 [Xylaria sp. CBS 124048]|nr:hypothetical protein GGR50DRAFT_598784 [Xylaria sp. CBS 124048]
MMFPVNVYLQLAVDTVSSALMMFLRHRYCSTFRPGSSHMAVRLMQHWCLTWSVDMRISRHRHAMPFWAQLGSHLVPLSHCPIPLSRLTRILPVVFRVRSPLWIVRRRSSPALPFAQDLRAFCTLLSLRSGVCLAESPLSRATRITWSAAWWSEASLRLIYSHHRGTCYIQVGIVSGTLALCEILRCLQMKLNSCILMLPLYSESCIGIGLLPD